MTSVITPCWATMSSVIFYGAGDPAGEDLDDVGHKSENGGGRRRPDEPARCERHQSARGGPPYRHATGVDRPSFPDGKQQLIEDALVYAGKQVSGPLKHLTQKQGAVGGFRAFMSLWRQTLERTKFQAGCPVLAVAVEQFVNDATEKDGAPDEAAQQRLLDLAEGVFADWQKIMVTALRREGLSRPGAAARGPGRCVDGRCGRDVSRRAKRPASRRCQAELDWCF